MRILGIDYGSKRIGLAVSDETESMAFPYTVLETKKFIENKFNILKEFCKKEDIKQIVVGLPLSFSGKEQSQAVETRAFIDNLKKSVNLPVEFENEVLTTELAKKHLISAAGKKIKEKIDASAAAIILQSFLDRRKKMI